MARRRLAAPQASGCLLRVRTCPEFKLSRAYGRVVADEAVEGLFHLAACDPEDAVAMDFEFTRAHGFRPEGDQSVTPVVQVRLE